MNKTNTKKNQDSLSGAVGVSLQKPEWWPECPYPKSVFPMTIDQYVEFIPDNKSRTAISGLLYREGWNVANKQIWEYMQEYLEDLKTEALDG